MPALSFLKKLQASLGKNLKILRFRIFPTNGASAVLLHLNRPVAAAIQSSTSAGFSHPLPALSTSVLTTALLPLVISSPLSLLFHQALPKRYSFPHVSGYFPYFTIALLALNSVTQL